MKDNMKEILTDVGEFLGVGVYIVLGVTNLAIGMKAFMDFMGWTEE